MGHRLPVRRHLKRFLTVAATVGLMISYLPLAPASPPGTTPFGFFKNMQAVFKSIGAYTVANGGWSSSFSSSANGPADNAFSLVGDLAVDGANGFLYAVEVNNHRVTKINARTGVVVGSIGRTTATSGTCPASGAAPGWCTGGTFASGTTDGTFGNPYGIAIDTTRDRMYVADSSNHRISKFTLSTGAYIGSIGRTTATSGTCPASGAANFWCTGGTFASGTADGQMNVPQSLAIDMSNEYLFVTEVSGFRISKFDGGSGLFMGAIGYSSATTGTCPSGAVAPSWCTGGTFAASSVDGGWTKPSAIVFDPADEYLYITDYQLGRVSEVDSYFGNYIGSIGYSTSSTGTCPSGAAANAWCTGGNFTGNAAGGFIQPYGIAVDGSSLYVTDFAAGGHRVQKRTRSTGALVGRIGYTSASSGTCPVGATSTSWCTGGTYVSYNYEGGYAGPRGVAIDPSSGFLYVAASSDRISRVVASTGATAGSIGRRVVPLKSFSPGISGFANASVDGGFSAASGIALDKTNKLLYVRDDFKIGRYNATTGEFMGAVGRLSVPLTGSNCPTSAAASTWCYRGVFTSSGADGGFSNSNYGIDVDPANNAIYLADGTRVVKINATTGAFIGAIGVTTASTGTCPASGAASGWCTGGTFTASTANGGYNSAYRIAVDSTNNRLYVTDGYRVIQINASTGAFIGAIGKTSASSGTCPASGLTTGWCTGGTFTNAVEAGGFWTINDVEVDPANDVLWVLEGPPAYRVSKFTRSTGAYVGSVGKVSGSTGTCPGSGVAPSWCTGGTGTYGSTDGAFFGPSSLAYDAVGGHLYVSDAPDHRIIKLSAATGAFIGAAGYMTASTGTCAVGQTNHDFCTGGTSATGTTDGRFASPAGVAYGNGFLYVVDQNNFRIQRR